MSNDPISINEATGYLNLEQTGNHSDSTGTPRLNTSTSHPHIEPNKLFKDDRQGRPNMEL